MTVAATDRSPPQEIGDLRLFEGPFEGEQGRVVYQGEEVEPPEGEHTAHEYWIVEKWGADRWRLIDTVATFERGEGYHRHRSDVVDVYPSNDAAVAGLKGYLDSSRGGSDAGELAAPALYDGSIRFFPPNTKREAGYTTTNDRDFDHGHERCRDCVHFIEGGGCHLVQGEIDPSAYCDEYYADYGVFAHGHGGYVEVNLEMIGRKYDLDRDDIEDLVDEIEERAQQRLRESE